MKLEDLGFSAGLERYREDNNLHSFEVGRVIAEHKERYTVKTENKDFDSELVGNLRFTASDRSDFPAVGDWVAISGYDEEKALIHAIFPRHSIIERQAVGAKGQKQIIATNIDFGIIVQSVNRDYSINRLERYLTICNTSNVKPIIVLSKIDLLDREKLEAFLRQIKERIKDVPLIALSNQTQEGLTELSSILERGKTYCLLGSSGVGKSTLINALSGSEVMETGTISKSIDRGRHITSHRELIILENGSILIDNPGMREVGITDSASGIEITFDTIAQLSRECKYSDCTHTNEKGCAVLQAVENGEIDKDSYNNFQKLQREKEHYEMTVSEKRKKDKDFGKIVKNFKKKKYGSRS